jgi:nickel-dependent lactate racemase
MLAALLAEIGTKTSPDDIVVLVATGTHRANTVAEMEAMFGREILDRVRVVNHDARDASSLVDLGTMGDGVPVQLNREWVMADVRVTTGFVEPHFFAGFSGGPKLVAPGLAGLETTLVLHDARRIASPLATWGITEGNPVHDDVRAIARGSGTHFGCDVVLNRQHQVVAAFAGELFAMHDAAMAKARRAAMRPVSHRFDVVVTSNAGYPLDQNLYQAVKGMSAASQIVKPGGLIVIAAECRDGFPEHGEFRRLLASASSPSAVLADVAERHQTVPDQWQAQILARILASARVAVYTRALSAADLEAAFLLKCEDIEETVAEEIGRLGPSATCCALPAGPETIPFVAGA